MSDKLKRGRWTKSELNYITKNAMTMPVELIANKLNRDIETVQKWIRENLALDVSGDEPVALQDTEIRNELRDSPEWEELSQQFIGEELKAFEHKYAKLIGQFKRQGDVLPTEEMQIFHLIKFNILMDRNLKNRARAMQDIQRLEKQLAGLYEDYPSTENMDDSTRDLIQNLEQQLISARDAESSKTAEYVKLSEKHSAIMKELKATRDQRMSKIENSKMSFLGWLKALQEEEVRQQEGEDMELMRAAVVVETERLSKSHKYVDDSIDQPLLTPENV
jgi:hypothetical protein